MGPSVLSVVPILKGQEQGQDLIGPLSTMFSFKGHLFGIVLAFEGELVSELTEQPRDEAKEIKEQDEQRQAEQAGQAILFPDNGVEHFPIHHVRLRISCR